LASGFRVRVNATLASVLKSRSGFLAEDSVDLSNIDPPNEHVTVY